MQLQGCNISGITDLGGTAPTTAALLGMVAGSLGMTVLPREGKKVALCVRAVGSCGPWAGAGH